MEGYNQQAALREYLDELLDRERSEPPKDMFQVYRWHVCRGYWYPESLQTARSLDSVVLPTPLKKDIIQDLEQFLHEDTRDWYNRHGIPYKRSYIFYGPPGTGKTSFIQALAGAYGRNVCFLQPNDPRFTDDTFKTCLQKAPDNSIIVLEDIDALFNERNSMNKSCPLTFTGLLNGLDGIGNALGQLFVLSTNHLERLDPALSARGASTASSSSPTAQRRPFSSCSRGFTRTRKWLKTLRRPFAPRRTASLRRTCSRPSSPTCTTPTCKWWSTWRALLTPTVKKRRKRLFWSSTETLRRSGPCRTRRGSAKKRQRKKPWKRKSKQN